MFRPSRRFERPFRVAVTAVVLFGAVSCTDDPPPSDRGTPSKTEAGPRDWLRGACHLPKRFVTRIDRGLLPSRSPDVMFVPPAGTYFSGNAHSGPNDHLQEVPIVLYGPGFIQPRGQIALGNDPTVADLPATYAELLDVSLAPGTSGKPITPALTGRKGPAVIVTVVWDAGGWNVLRRWPRAWPFLTRLIEEGTSVTDATVGSSPSVTPPIHATIGTGAFPKKHGIVDIPQRVGDDIVDSWEGTSPEQLQMATLADIYDRSVGNRAKIGVLAERRWHLGMIGRGALAPQGDKDIAILEDVQTRGELFSNEDYYELPTYLEDKELFEAAVRKADAEDGTLDSRWLGHDVLDDPYDLRWTPAWGDYQTDLLEELIRREGLGSDDITDLLYVNYKLIDHVGHRWAMAGPEMKRAVEHSDEELKELVTFLDEEVGRGRWVLGLTADHGAQPRTGGVVIVQSTLTEKVEEHFSAEPGELILEDRPLGMWLDRDYMSAQGITPAHVATYLSRLTAADLETGAPSERLFSAAFPTAEWGRVRRCTGR